MKDKRLLIPVLVALALPMMGCFQCAAGRDISQSVNLTVSQDLTCITIVVGLSIIILGFMALVGAGGGMGSGGE